MTPLLTIGLVFLFLTLFEQEIINKTMSWIFEPDAKRDTDGKICVDEEHDAMNYVLNFGKHKGQSFAELMQTENGRGYLKWLSLQPCNDPLYQDAHAKRIERIAKCFVIYERWLKGQ